MTTALKKPLVKVRTNFFEEASEVFLSEDTMMNNRFYLKVKRFHNEKTVVEINTHIGKRETVSFTVNLKEFRRFQDHLLDVLDNKNTGRRIVLGDEHFNFVHLPTGELGMDFNGNKFLLPRDAALRLRTFAAETLH